MKKTILILSLFLLLILPGHSAIGETEGDYVYEIRDNGAVILSYSGSDTELNVPFSLGNSTVVGIAEGVFENNYNIQSIAMPSSIEFIGDRAFSNCRNLVSGSISAGLKHIGAEAFADCVSLTYFILPYGLETIGEKAFAGCTNIVYFQDLTGEPLHEIGVGAFDDTLWFKNESAELLTINQGRFLLKYRGTEERYALPWYITYIAEDAFAGNDHVVSLILSNNMKKLQRGSISHMPNLQSVSCDTPVGFVDDGAFNDLPALETVLIGKEDLGAGNFIDCPKSPFGTESSGPYDPDLPDGSDALFISEYDETSGGVVILHCKADIWITDGVLQIPETIRGKRVTAVGTGACEDREDIRKVIFPRYMKEIRSWAFAYDSNLSEAVFPESLERIDADAFNRCGLNSEEYDLNNTAVDERAFYKSAN